MFKKTSKKKFSPVFGDIRAILCLLFLCFAAGTLSSQANELEAVLGSSAVTYAQAARFTLASTGKDNNVNTAQAAFNLAIERGWLPKGASLQDPINLAELSFLITSAFDIKGGFMYKFFPGPRYAFRAMVSRSLIQGPADPSMTVSGQRFLHILGNTVSFTGGEQ